MPVDVTQLIPQLRQMAVRSAEGRRSRDQQVTHLRRVFTSVFDVSSLESAIAAVTRMTAVKWSGARFTSNEAVNQFYPTGIELIDYALIATDGSQIMPDRHKAVQYAAIQVAGAGIVYGHSSLPDRLPHAFSATKRKPITFKDETQLYDDSGELISPGEISTERDLMEIELLATHCEAFRDAGLRSIAVADASIVPFALLNEQLVRNSPRRAAELLERITRALNRMKACDAIVGGYIDRPNSNALTRTCALADVPHEALADRRTLGNALKRLDQNIRGISDRFLLEPLLQPSKRTALFEPTWLVNGPAYLGQSGHTMRCCYLNVSADRPAIVRIEMPEWCSDTISVGIMAKVMERHANMGGGYPLILKAAHEEAVLSPNDERAIDRMIERSMIEEGILAMPSFKQEAKDKR
jgi:hypothetical protein